MRAVIQRVSRASVEVNNEIIASISKGLLILAGFHVNDTEKEMDYIINKAIGARIFDDSNNIMNLSVEEIDGEVLLVSQFTLYGDLRKGKRPSYSNAMTPDKANHLYDLFVNKTKDRYNKVKSGVFGANMKVDLVNSGPVTIILDSSKNL